MLRFPKLSITRDVLEALRRSLTTRFGRPPHNDEFVSAMLENRLPMLSFDGIGGRYAAKDGPLRPEDGWMLDLVQSEPFQIALHQETDLYERAHGHFVTIATAWSSRGVEWICFKSSGIDPAFPYTSDNFDILVAPESRAAAREELLAQGYVELRNIEEPQKWLFRLFVGGESVSAIHLHTRVGWGQGFMIEPEIWRRRTALGGRSMDVGPRTRRFDPH